jgi:uncharacterized protein
MNPQEYQALRSLLAQLVEIRRVTKDPEADLLIREAAVRQPDTTYLLAQRTLLLSLSIARMTVMASATRAMTLSEPIQMRATTTAS